jgi:uncharacterized membrane protein
VSAALAGRWVEEDGPTRSVLRTPASAWWVQGLLLVFVLPPALVSLLGLLVALGTGGDPVGFGIFVGLAALLSVPAALAGVWMVVVSGSRSEASVVAVDWGGGRLEDAEGRAVPFSRVEAVEVVQPNAMLKWREVQARVSGGPPVVLARRVTPRLFAEARALCGPLAGRLGVPLKLPGDVRSGDLVGLNDRHAAAFCYVPLQGIFLVASLWYVFQARERPFVRFAAVQSLLQVAFSMVVPLLCIALTVGVVAGVDAAGAEPGIAGLVVLPVWLVFLAFHLGSRVSASVQAVWGRTTLFPWFIPVLRGRRPADLVGSPAA